MKEKKRKRRKEMEMERKEKKRKGKKEKKRKEKKRKKRKEKKRKEKKGKETIRKRKRRKGKESKGKGKEKKKKKKEDKGLHPFRIGKFGCGGLRRGKEYHSGVRIGRPQGLANLDPFQPKTPHPQGTWRGQVQRNFFDLIKLNKGKNMESQKLFSLMAMTTVDILGLSQGVND